jgi:hypothetical protein
MCHSTSGIKNMWEKQRWRLKKQGVKFGLDLTGSRVQRWALVNILMNF